MTAQILQQLRDEHPYKVRGDHSTYSDYNQGWSNALDRVEELIQPKLQRVSDGLPEVRMRVLGQTKEGQIEPMIYERGEFYRYIDTCFADRTISSYYPDVVAFMPFPEPIKIEL